MGEKGHVLRARKDSATYTKKETDKKRIGLMEIEREEI